LPLQENLILPYHQAILNDKIPLSIGGGIGQARTSAKNSPFRRSDSNNLAATA